MRREEKNMLSLLSYGYDSSLREAWFWGVPSMIRMCCYRGKVVILNVRVSCLCLATMMPLCLCSHSSKCVFVRHDLYYIIALYWFTQLYSAVKDVKGHVWRRILNSDSHIVSAFLKNLMDVRNPCADQFAATGQVQHDPLAALAVWVPQWTFSQMYVFVGSREFGYWKTKFASAQGKHMLRWFGD